MRKTVTILVLLMFTLCFASVAQAAPKVVLDGRDLLFEVPPVNENGTVLVPLRGIFEALGARVDWDGATRTVISTRGNTTVKLTIGYRTAFVNGDQVDLRVPSMVVRGSTLVPLRFVSEALGAHVTWDSITQTVIIKSYGWPVKDTYENIRFTEIDPAEAPAEIERWVERSKRYELAQSKSLGGKTYLLVTRGEKNTGGYGVYISRIEDRADEVVVSVRYTEPRGMVIQALTYPLTLVEIPRVDKPVRFVGGEGGIIAPQPEDNDLQPVLNSTGNIKLYKPLWGKKDIVVKGTAKTYGAELAYLVKNHNGKVIREGNLTSHYRYDTWIPFEITVPRTDFGGGQKLTVSITRTTDYGSKETVNLTLYEY